MRKVVWSPEFETGIKLIDEQHKKLVQIIGTLSDMADGRATFGDNPKIIKDLEEYVLVHFAVEEDLMRIYGYQDDDRHQEKHDEFRTKMSDFRKALDDGDMFISKALFAFLNLWLIHHIQKDDMRLCGHLKAVGVSV